MEVLIVEGKRYLINTNVSEKAQDEACERILEGYPADAEVDWDDNVTMEDVLPRTIKQLINNK